MLPLILQKFPTWLHTTTEFGLCEESKQHWSVGAATKSKACEQAPGERGKNFGKCETEEFEEQSDRGRDREPVDFVFDLPIRPW